MYKSVYLGSLWISSLIIGYSIVFGQNVTNKCINELVQIDCSDRPHCYIHVVSAYYGHPTNNRPIEGCAFALGHCITNATDVWNRCHGSKRCEFYVRQARDEVRAVCDRPSEYLTVTYECKCTEPCPRLATTKHLHVSYSKDSLEFGTKATFSCGHGLVLTGPRETTCTTSGQWSDVLPVCSVPSSACSSGETPEHGLAEMTYKTTCLQLHDKSFAWFAAQARCNITNHALLNVTNDDDKINFIGWWLDSLDVEGYVWTALEPSGNDCLELYKDVTGGGRWLQRTVPCSLRNLYICEYEANEIVKPETSSKKIDVHMIVGISIGLVVLCLFCCVFIILLIWRRRQRRRKEMENNITMITSPSTSSCNLAEQEYIYSNVVGDPTSNGEIQNQTLNCRPDISSGTHESPTYDDVYVPKQESNPNENNKNGSIVHGEDNVCVGNSMVKPPTKRKPRPAGARFYTKHTYENVALHNLTESLKRKFFPRKGSSVKPKELLKGPKRIKETSLSVISPVPHDVNGTTQCDCNSCPIAPERTVSKSYLTQYGNGKCRFCGKRENAMDCQDGQEPVSYSTVLVKPGNRRSSGLRVVDNSLYDGGVAESSA